MKTSLLLVLVSIAGVMPLHADMVTLRSNETYYGSILSLTGEKLTLRAQFPNHTEKDLVFDRAKLARIEFNDKKSNDGPPPEALGAHSGSTANVSPADSRPKDTILFRQGQNLACPGIVIDEKKITCGASVYDRTERSIWRIYFAGM